MRHAGDADGIIVFSASAGFEPWIVEGVEHQELVCENTLNSQKAQGGISLVLLLLSREIKHLSFSSSIFRP